MNLKHVESFIAVAEAGSFRDAAVRSARSQPLLSQHILKLEAELGVRLLERQNNGCYPTPRGEAFLTYAESLLKLARHARKATGEGQVALGAASNPGVFLLPPLIKAFRETHPNIGLDFSIGSNPDITDRLLSGELDVAVLECWQDHPGCVADSWGNDELVIIVGPEHSWVGRKTVSAEALRGAELLGGERGSGTGRILRECLGDISQTIRVPMNLGSTEAVKRAVEAGLGMSIVLATSVANEVREGRLAALRLCDRRIYKRLYLAYRAEMPDTSNGRLLIEFLGGHKAGAQI